MFIFKRKLRRLDRRETERAREALEIQLHANELFEVEKALRTPVNFLVFGMGHDSGFWHERNPGGRTAFIEDQEFWFKKIQAQHPFLESYLVNYETKREDWKRLLDSPGQLHLSLPESIVKTRWDVILIDGPGGDRDGTPGRMKSIYMASLLVSPNGHVFVHDSEREIEREYGNRFLLEKNLVGEVRGRALLRHYRMKK